MAFDPHGDFQAPPNPDARIWRYMDLAKFLSLLDRSAMYFPRVDKLASADAFEGYYTNVNSQIEKLSFKDFPADWLKERKLDDENAFNTYMEVFRYAGPLAKAMRETTYVSSWHVFEHESAAMWALYLRSEDGIAVQSSYRRLIDSFKKYTDFGIHVGVIRYIDYDAEAIPVGQAFYPIMHKRKSFEHERELRAVIWTVEDNKNELPIHDPSVNKFCEIPGLYVNVDLDLLIERIYVAPSAPKWILELLASLVQRYGLKKEIVHSRLAASPLY